METDPPCTQNTVLYLLSCMQLLTCCLCLSIGKPFRKPFYSNSLADALPITATISAPDDDASSPQLLGGLVGDCMGTASRLLRPRAAQIISSLTAGSVVRADGPGASSSF